MIGFSTTVLLYSFLISNLIGQGLDVIEKDPNFLVVKGHEVLGQIFTFVDMQDV